MDKKYDGINAHRLKQNPKEQAFHDAWADEHEFHGDLLDTLLRPLNTSPLVTARDRKVAATIIQWLGSPVGQAFLEHTQEKANQAAFDNANIPWGFVP